MRQGVGVFDGYIIEFPVVDAKADSTIFLLHAYYWRRPNTVMAELLLAGSCPAQPSVLLPSC